MATKEQGMPPAQELGGWALQAPPHDIQAEMGVLGSMLLSPDAIRMARELLEATSFYNLRHQDIFDAMLNLAASHNTVDLILLRDELDRQGKLQTVGEAAYLTELMEAVPTSANVEYYIEIVRDKASRRTLINRLREVQESASAPCIEILDLCARAKEDIREVEERVQFEKPQTIREMLLEALAEVDARAKGEVPEPVGSGLLKLDSITRGFHPGELTVIAGRPGMGKTTLALNILRDTTTEQGRRAVFFSAEMGHKQLLRNLLCCTGGINTESMRIGKFSETELDACGEAVEKLADADIIIDDTPSICIEDLVTRAIAEHRKRPLDIVFVDFLTLIKTRDGARKGEPENLRVGEIAKECKRLARELNAPALLLAQVNREPVKGESPRRARMSDLKWSGDIEEAADMVIILDRTDFGSDWEPEEHGDAVKRLLCLDKNRNGPTGIAHVTFKKSTLQFCTEDLPF